MALDGRVCIVTGASRGIGKGIALQLGEAGATVYITGRTLKNKDGTIGSLEETAKEIEARGGKCIAVQCDHTKNDDIIALFKKVKTEHNGRLDVMVNNAYGNVEFIFENLDKRYWELPGSAEDAWDLANNAGLRNHYICTVEATKMMVPRESGLIINVSSPGGLAYLFNVPYGVGKIAVDRMAADCAMELRKSRVTMVSLWPGPVLTEIILKMFENPDLPERTGGPLGFTFPIRQLYSGLETIEYAGKAVVGLASDSNVVSKTGKVLLTCDLASEYNFKDINGSTPSSIRTVNYWVAALGWKKTAYYIPNWVKIPKFMFTLVGHKY